MPNPIADPLVEAVDSDADSPLVRLDATPSGAVTVWINCPERHNALDSLTVSALHEAFETLQGAEGVRIVFLRGVGGHFSAAPGAADLALLSDLNEDDHHADAKALARMFATLSEIPALTVALVEGDAFNAGAGLVAACDLALASADARFGLTDVRLGLWPSVVAPYLVEAVGSRTTRGLAALGRPFDAAHAAAIGLVRSVVADGTALDAAQADLAEEVLACAPKAVAKAKAVIRHGAGRPIDHALLDEAARGRAQAMVSDEAREGLAALLEGRKPSWTRI